LYVTDELASLTNRVASCRKNIAAGNKFRLSAKPLHRNKIQRCLYHLCLDHGGG
jgi:hypothetical protein